MKNLYHKVAVASVCTALGFVLGESQKAKAATFNLAPTITFEVIDYTWDGNSFDGLGEVVFHGHFYSVLRGTEGEIANFAEFNIGSFPLAPNTVISSAVVQAVISSSIWYGLGVEGKVLNLVVLAFSAM